MRYACLLIQLTVPTRIRGLAVFTESMAVGLACGDQRRLTGSGSALEALGDDALYKSMYFTLFFLMFVCSLCHLAEILQLK